MQFLGYEIKDYVSTDFDYELGEITFNPHNLKYSKAIPVIM